MSRHLQGNFVLLPQNNLLRVIHCVYLSPFNRDIKNDSSFLKFILAFFSRALSPLCSLWPLTIPKETCIQIFNPHYRQGNWELQISNWSQEKNNGFPAERRLGNKISMPCPITFMVEFNEIHRKEHTKYNWVPFQLAWVFYIYPDCVYKPIIIIEIQPTVIEYIYYVKYLFFI